MLPFAVMTMFGIMQRVVEPNPYLGQTRDAASVFSSSNIQKCRVRLECLPTGWLQMLQKSITVWVRTFDGGYEVVPYTLFSFFFF
jgi:hypothetical protein